MSDLLPILAAEDEESEAIILRLAFKRARIPHPLVILRDGQEVLDYLGGAEPYTDRSVHPLPALLILDLKMPRMNGVEVLAWLATQPEFKSLPAVMLSSSSHQTDIEKARRLGAREYFVKPHEFSDLIKIVQQLQTRWLPPPP